VRKLAAETCGHRARVERAQAVEEHALEGERAAREQRAAAQSEDDLRVDLPVRDQVAPGVEGLQLRVGEADLTAGAADRRVQQDEARVQLGEVGGALVERLLAQPLRSGQAGLAEQRVAPLEGGAEVLALEVAVALAGGRVGAHQRVEERDLLVAQLRGIHGQLLEVAQAPHEALSQHRRAAEAPPLVLPQGAEHGVQALAVPVEGHVLERRRVGGAALDDGRDGRLEC
jgi:hypothetical protein